jgi:hypothetical protein
MKGPLLSLPVLAVAMPLLFYLLLASDPSLGEHGKDFGISVDVADQGPLPDAAAMERLARTDRIAFLENCLRYYNHKVLGYHLIMQKQERLGGHLMPREIIEVFFKDKPHSVFLSWLEGARKADRALYVEGDNNGQMLARPAGSLLRRIMGDVVARDVAGDDARQSGRFTLDKYGLKKGTERYLASWKDARANGELRVEYLGKEVIAQAGDRLCHRFHRSCVKPENDGVMEQTLFIDAETWLQAGSIIRGARGELIGEYYFRNIELNPTFKPDQFQRAALLR